MLGFPPCTTVSEHRTRLPEDLIELIARRFRVLGEPMRIKLLDRLRDGPATVGELQAATSSSQQNVSKHLGVLHDAGVLRRRKDGNFVSYDIADQGVVDLCDQVCGASSPSSTNSARTTIRSPTRSLRRRKP